MISKNIYDVIQYGNPFLYQKSKPVEDPTSREIKSIVDKMIRTIEARNAVGLAAPQVGIPLSLFVFRIPKKTDNPKYVLTPEYDPEGIPMTVLVNPSLSPVGDQMKEEWEGCQSFPGLIAKVHRYHQVNYTYKNLEGNHISKTAFGFHARVIQHEYDHLEGILIPQRITKLKKNGICRRIS